MEHLADTHVALATEDSTLPRDVRPGEYVPRAYPQVIKYMGSKAAILDFLGAGFSALDHLNKPIVDLFAGAGAVSGGFGHRNRIISNDIQEYSAVIASTYLKRAEKIGAFDIVERASRIATDNVAALSPNMRYPDSCSLEQFNEIEARNRELIYEEFDSSHHLFSRVYAGTWWSAEQCIWIDAIRQVLDELLDDNKIELADFNFGLTCLLHAMAYSSQGTGHYAQYRDAKDETSMLDISRYRKASVPSVFQRKFGPLLKWNLANVVDRGHELVSMDYVDCLRSSPRSIVYADPPYAFVHYSRFYHAMETLVKYDYPVLQVKGERLVKGRYRNDRHQSPFCIRSQVQGAFREMFEGVKASESDLVLSYSNTGMITIENLIDLATSAFGTSYQVWFNRTGHDHKTMGRRSDHSRQVEESLIIAKKL
ncbi:DNA adenine methylase [Caballeronia sp. LZ019]|uniref:DNA adenine methylase n=1 Tax=Caballeronia sp. LZ019 TaxID=3038555 RepID=UPI0028641E25|nr:DNA adenine methylase [Caballeronia sp. LZ019]MDR5809534.1 DNA adenine methylase [Caballeronia sp. LZ019]